MTMKREGYIIEEIIARENLEESFDTVVRGTQRKSLREGKWLTNHRKEFLDVVEREIAEGRINLSGYHDKIIHEGVKDRKIQVFCMKDRIRVNAVMSVVDKHLRKRYIRTTSASIKKRGMHELKSYIERDMKEDPSIRYWYKFDIRKFYENVRQDFVMYALHRVFKDGRLLAIMEQLVRLMPGNIGISMGLRSSQGVGNLLLSVFLDHYLKDRYRVRHFYRYCDDGLIGSSNKLYLWECRDLVHECAEGIGQTVKPDERVFPIESGLDFLGYVIYPTHSLLRKRVKKTFCRKLARVKSRKRRQQIVGSFYGMAKHADCRHLLGKVLFPGELNKIKNNRRKNMRKFSELGITYEPKDGKKRFHGKTVRLGSIVNNEIEIHDYERDVKTSQGENRYLVSYKDVRTGEMCKFFTNSQEMKSQLESVSKMEDGFPFSTVIRSESYDSGQGFHYFFT